MINILKEKFKHNLDLLKIKTQNYNRMLFDFLLRKWIKIVVWVGKYEYLTTKNIRPSRDSLKCSLLKHFPCKGIFPKFASQKNYFLF